MNKSPVKFKENFNKISLKKNKTRKNLRNMANFNQTMILESKSSQNMDLDEVVPLQFVLG